MTRATIRSRGQITLPKEVRAALHVDEGDDVAFTVEDGRVVMQGLTTIPADQAWFWTDEWQRGEQEASKQIDEGAGATFASGADFLDSFK